MHSHSISSWLQRFSSCSFSLGLPSSSRRRICRPLRIVERSGRGSESAAIRMSAICTWPKCCSLCKYMHASTRNYRLIFLQNGLFISSDYRLTDMQICLVFPEFPLVFPLTLTRTLTPNPTLTSSLFLPQHGFGEYAEHCWSQLVCGTLFGIVERDWVKIVRIRAPMHATTPITFACDVTTSTDG